MDMTKQGRKFTNPFSAALNHCIRMSGETNDIVGEAAGYKSKGKAIDQIRNERSEGKYKYQRAIAEHFGYTLDAFVDFGKELIFEQNKQAMLKKTNTSNVISIDQQHADIIKKFQNRNMALTINQELLDLESVDPDKLKSVLDFIKWQKKEALEEASKKRNVSNEKE